MGRARVRFTDRRDGDLLETAPGVDARRRAVVDLPWTWTRQVHGAEVRVVNEPGGEAGAVADGLVTSVPGAAVSVKVADCGPVALASPEGVVGVAHAGWMGLMAGVVEATVDAMRDLGATDVVAALGPCIRPCCYEFGPADLDRVAGQLGGEVRSTTSAGAPALDLAAGVRAALARCGARLVHDARVCTACSPRYWSHRRDGDPERQAVVAWLS